MWVNNLLQMSWHESAKNFYKNIFHFVLRFNGFIHCYRVLGREKQKIQKQRKLNILAQALHSFFFPQSGITYQIRCMKVNFVY